MNEFVLGLLLGAGGLAGVQWLSLWWFGRPRRATMPRDYYSICGHSGRECTVTGENRIGR